MGDSSEGSLWTDVVQTPGGGRRLNLTFGVQERQAGRVAAMNIQGLLALDRSHNSFIGQVGKGAGLS